MNEQKPHEHARRLGLHIMAAALRPGTARYWTVYAACEHPADPLTRDQLVNPGSCEICEGGQA